MEKRILSFFTFALFMIAMTGCSTPLTKREKGAGIGALGGAAVGGIIGSAVGSPGAGAAIGSVVGAGAGALIGDQLQGQDQRQQDQQVKLDQQNKDLQRNRKLIEELKQRNIEARETDRGVAVNIPNVVFQFGKSDLTPSGRQRVDEIATIVKGQGTDRRITVEGHASRERADQEAYNQKLSEKRAQSVAGALEEKGVSKNRIISKGFGTRYPVASNEAEEGRRKNRRVEVIIEN